MFGRKKDDDEKDKKKEEDKNRSFDRPGFDGRHPFDDIFRGSFFGEFSRMDEMINELMKNAFKDLEGGKFKEGKPFVYGFSMRTGPDGKPIINEFGNVKHRKHQEGKSMTDEREPLVDVINCDKEIMVVVELPGVNKEDIEAEVSGDTVTVRVDTEKKRYYKEIKIPEAVKEDAIDASYNNGVLEIKLKKIKPKKGKNIKIK